VSGRETEGTATEGTVEFTTSYNGRDETHHTWYKIVGADTGKPPLITLHGGPGATHDYLLSLADLASDRQVVFYDQLGNGKSAHLPDRGADFWTVDLFVRELRNLVARLGITRHHVLGQSWGGFLAQEYALTRPGGLASLVLADTAASFPEFLAECDRLRALLPPDVAETLRRHEEAGTTGDPGYVAACDVFYRRHVCRLADWPPEVTASFARIEADPTVYHTMNGPSEFHVIGSIKDWESKDRLPEISVPVLLVSGRHDEAGPAVQRTLLDGLPTVEWTVFGDSSHMPHWEERDRYMEVVGSWLRQHE
jgi:L-proline amide hydrolase